MRYPENRLYFSDFLKNLILELHKIFLRTAQTCRTTCLKKALLPASIIHIRAVTAAFIQMSISCMITFFESMCISKNFQSWNNGKRSSVCFISSNCLAFEHIHWEMFITMGFFPSIFVIVNYKSVDRNQPHLYL